MKKRSKKMMTMNNRWGSMSLAIKVKMKITMSKAVSSCQSFNIEVSQTWQT